MQAKKAAKIAEDIIDDNPDMNSLYQRAEREDLPVDYDDGFTRHGWPEDASGIVLDVDGDCDVLVRPVNSDSRYGWTVDIRVPDDRMRRRGMLAAAATISAAGPNPFDLDGELLVPEEPTPQDWQGELDNLGREEFDEFEREAYLDGWQAVMNPWRALIDDGENDPDATRRTAGHLLYDAVDADQPATPLRAARQLLGLSQVEMSKLMGVPTHGDQAQTVGRWERGTRVPEWEGRKKIRFLAKRLLAPSAEQAVDEAYDTTDAIIDALYKVGGDLVTLADDLAGSSGADADEIYDELHWHVDGWSVETTCGALSEASVISLDALGMPLEADELAKLRLRIDGEGQASWRVMVPQASGANLMSVEIVGWQTGAQLLD